MRKLIIILIFSIGFQSYSQEATLAEVDAQTYKLFIAEQWKDLIVYGKENVQDFYYYNVRMGVAYFNEREYHSAEKHFKKAISQENTEYAREYLFWTYINLGESFLAEQVYDQLSNETKMNIDYKKTAIESVYLELGLKSPDTDEAENTYYGNLVLRHRLGKNIHVLHSINSFFQSQSNQDYNSFQYHLVGTYYKEATAMSLGTIFTKSEFNFASNQLVEDDLGNVTVDYNSNNNSTIFSIYANYNRRFNRFRVNANFNLVNQNSTIKENTKIFSEFDGSLISDTNNTIKASENVYIPSAGFLYTPEFTGDVVTIGADVFFAIGESETNVIFKPYLNFFISNKFWINTNYIQVPDQLFTDFSSEILYNTPDLSVNRFVSTFNYAFSPKVITKLTYTYENYDFDLANLSYNINSIFLGLQYKF